MAIVDPFAASAARNIIDPFAAPAAATAQPSAEGTMEGFMPPAMGGQAIPPSAAPASAGQTPSRVPGIVSGALAPYATAAGAGALMGSPVGGIGAIPGAVAGVGALALSDLAALGYNLAAPRFGGRQIELPSQAIESAYRRVGVGAEPQTPGEAVLAASLRGGASALGGVGAARTIAQQATGPTTQRVANWFAAQPITQTAGGVGAGAATSTAQEYYGVQDPLTLALIGVAGGAGTAKVAPSGGRVLENIAGSAERLATGVRSSREALAQTVDDLFDTARSAGAAYTPQSYDKFIEQAKKTGAVIDPRATNLAAPVQNVLGEIERFRGAANSVEQLHDLRQSINVALRADIPPRAGDAIRNIRDDLDNYISTPSNIVVTSGDPTAGQKLVEGIRTYARQQRSEDILDLLERASMNKSVPLSSSIRTQFKQLADPKYPRRLAGFTDDEKEIIRGIAKGKAEWGPLNFVSSLTPSTNTALRAAIPAATGGATYYGTGDPFAAGAVSAALYGGGRGAQALQDRLAQNAVNRLAAGVRRNDVVAPSYMTAREAALRVAPIAVMNAMSPYGALDVNAFNQQ